MPCRYRRFLIAVAAASLSGAACASLFAPPTRLYPSDGAAEDYYGWSVALGAVTAVVGADGDDNERGVDVGAAYVHVRSGGAWTQQAKLVPSDGSPGDAFGFAVALDGDTAVIGAPQAGGGVGAAYVYVRSGSTWSLQKRLAPSDGIPGGYFGFSVSISGDTIVVGAVGDDDRGEGSGSAYVFTRSAGVWSQQQKLTATDGAALDSFGFSVWVNVDTAVISAFGDDDRGLDAGAVYVFTRTGVTWSPQQKLVAADGAAYDGFGYACVVKGSTLAVSAPYDDTPSGSDAGSVYTFVRSGSTWIPEARLTPNDAHASAYFGLGLGMDGDRLVAGATGARAGGIPTGAGYVFSRETGPWRQTSRLLAPDGKAGDELGVFAALYGATALLGGTQSSQSSPGLALLFDTAPTASPSIASVSVSDATRNGAVDVNECAGAFVTLLSGGASVSGVTGSITSLTPGVRTLPAPAAFGTLPALGTLTNGQPLRFYTQPDFVCGTPIVLALTLSTDDGVATLPFQLSTGTHSTQSFSAYGPVSIPDGTTAGASLPLTVSGVTAPVGKVTVAVYVKHPYVGDLRLTLSGPDGTSVTLVDRLPTGGDNFGTDCPASGNDTVFDDASASPITTGLAPFASAYSPVEPLSAFAGKSGGAANGVWTLKAADLAEDDTGTIECWTLNITTVRCADGGGPCEGWAGLAGDLNNDGSVTAADAALALRVYAGASNSSPEVVARGDVAPKPSASLYGYGDGRIDVRDAVRILRSLHGLGTLP